MPGNLDLPDDDPELVRLNEGGGLKARTLQDRRRHLNNFKDFLSKETDGKSLGEMLKDEEGRTRLDFLVGKFFNTMVVVVGTGDDGEPVQRKPKLGYAQKIRGCIKISIIEEFKVDICDPLLFPEASRRWKSFTDDLAVKGLAETVHYGEVDPQTMDMIFELLSNVENALDNRGSDDYDSSFLSKIPFGHRDKLNYILQYGAMFCALLFEARRGGENMELLKKVDFAVLEDAVKKLKFVKHIASEKDKNHGEGTVSALNGCIPFINFGSFNPGRFFEKYLNALPDNSTKPGIEGGFLFMRPRGNSKKWSMHSSDSKVLFEENVKVGKNYVYKMLGDLCSILGRPHQTNHSLRSSAVIYMRRSGLSWHTIAKITGHKNVDNLIKHYDTVMEAQGFVDVAVAIATGPSVAQGQSPIKVKLPNRLDRKRMSIVLDDEEVEQSNKGDSEKPDDIANLGSSGEAEEGPALKHQRLSIPDLKASNIPINDDAKSKKIQSSNDPSTAANNLSNNFCTASQSVSVTRGSTNTEAMQAVMSSYGTMLGQMAKGMLEGVGPQLMNMLQNFQESTVTRSESMEFGKLNGGEGSSPV